MVSVRDIHQPDRMSDGTLKHMAMIAYHRYNRFDLSMCCIHILRQLGSMPAEALDHLTRSISPGRIPKH